MALLIPLALLTILLAFVYNFKYILQSIQRHKRKMELMEKIFGFPTLPVIGNLHQIMPLNPQRK